MEKTPAQVQAMKEEIQAWIERYGFQEDTGWHDLEAHYEGKHREFGYPHYLVLGVDGAVSRLLRLADDHRDPAWQRTVLAEFNAILEKHNCWFEEEEAGILCIMDKDDRESSGLVNG